MGAAGHGEQTVRVVCDVAGLPRRFDYLVPAEWRGRLAIGSRVRVDLHGRRVAAWVVELGSEPPAGVALFALSGVSGLGPPAPVVELAEWAAWRWAGPLSFFLRSASPPRNVWALPSPPPAAAPATEPADAALAALGRAAASGGVPVLLRLGPCADPLPFVEGVVAAHAVAGRRGSVLVLVPSVGWARRLTDRLVRRGVPATHEPTDWAGAAAGWPVIVGTRASAFAPVPLLGAAVVLDAHDEAYRDERAPTWSAVDVVAERARRDGATMVAVSAAPTVGLLEGSVLLTTEPGRERAEWPRLVVCDRRGADPRTGLVAEELVGRLRRLLEDGSAHADRPAVVVLNRTGRARLLACAACGELVRCERCGRALAEGDDALVCPGCGLERPRVCAACGATRLKVLRAGVTRVAGDLAALVGEAVGEVSGASRPGDQGGDGAAGDGAAGDGAAGHGAGRRVLLGTEAVLHRVRRAALVAFLDFDQHLLAARTDAAETALVLLARAGRLVGARSVRDAGAVFVQTRLPADPVLLAAATGDPGPLAAAERAVRSQLGLPPFSALAVVSGADAADYVATVDDVEVRPLEGARFLLRAPDHGTLADALAAAPRARASIRVVVDPTSV